MEVKANPILFKTVTCLIHNGTFFIPYLNIHEEDIVVFLSEEVINFDNFLLCVGCINLYTYSNALIYNAQFPTKKREHEKKTLLILKLPLKFQFKAKNFLKTPWMQNKPSAEVKTWKFISNVSWNFEEWVEKFVDTFLKQKLWATSSVTQTDPFLLFLNSVLFKTM